MRGEGGVGKGQWRVGKGGMLTAAKATLERAATRATNLAPKSMIACVEKTD